MTQVDNFLNYVVPAGSEAAEAGYNQRETLSSPGNGKSWLIPNGINNLGFLIDASAGNAQIQYTFSPLDLVNADDVSVIWTAHPNSPFTTKAADSVLPAVTAIRQINTSGTTILEIGAR